MAKEKREGKELMEKCSFCGRKLNTVAKMIKAPRAENVYNYKRYNYNKYSSCKEKTKTKNKSHYFILTPKVPADY